MKVALCFNSVLYLSLHAVLMAAFPCCSAGIGQREVGGQYCVLWETVFSCCAFQFNSVQLCICALGILVVLLSKTEVQSLNTRIKMLSKPPSLPSKQNIHKSLPPFCNKQKSFRSPRTAEPGGYFRGLVLPVLSHLQGLPVPNWANFDWITQ